MQTLELKNYLVPFDFTQSTKDAFNYAKMLVEQNGGNILLMHLVNEEAQIPAASKTLDKMITSLPEK